MSEIKNFKWVRCEVRQIRDQIEIVRDAVMDESEFAILGALTQALNAVSTAEVYALEKIERVEDAVLLPWRC